MFKIYRFSTQPPSPQELGFLLPLVLKCTNVISWTTAAMESLAEFLFGAVIRVFLSVSVIMIDKQIVQRRDRIARKGRQLQKILHLPDYMCVFANAEPGILHRDLRLAAELLGFACLTGTFGLVLALFKGTL